MSNFPETPEAAAYALLNMILDREDSEPSRGRNKPMARHILDLYAECLAVANGRDADAAASWRALQ